MRVTRLGRIVGALCLAAGFVLTVAGTSSAAPPKWGMKVTNLPDMVGSGGGLGYRVVITNPGPSNISQLYLFTETQQAPAYVVTSQGSCPNLASGALYCSLGALGGTKSHPGTVTVTVAYAHQFTDTGGDPGEPLFQANTTGVSSSDGGTSHGDTLTDPTHVPTVISTSSDFAGGFSLDGGAVSTDQTLTAGNQQSTRVVPPAEATHSVVTVQDGSDVSFPCKKVCSKAFGQWSSVDVGGGQSFDTYFPVTLRVPAALAPSNVSKVVMAHVDAVTGAVQVLGQCAKNAPLQDCIVVSTDGVTVTMQAWVDHNGGFKGMG